MTYEGPSPIVKAVVRVLWPLFVLPYFFVKYLYKGILGWWLDPWLLERDRKRLWSDILDNMPFITTNGNVVKEKKPLRSFDYASIYLEIGNVRICITRGRGEIAVSLAPLICLDDWYPLGVVFEALGCAQDTNEWFLGGLREVDRVLERHWTSIKTEFSENQYPQFKIALSGIRHQQQRAAREVQWELAKHVSRQRR